VVFEVQTQLRNLGWTFQSLIFKCSFF